MERRRGVRVGEAETGTVSGRGWRDGDVLFFDASEIDAPCRRKRWRAVCYAAVFGEDAHGNIVYRLMLQPGRNEIAHDALVAVPSAPDNAGLNLYNPASLPDLPAALLRYTLPSRYCDSDKLNLPARYVTGHLADIGFVDPGTPMDFHAYFEVYVAGDWFTYDARFNVPRIGRVKVAGGFDAVDVAFATTYGSAELSYFEVWAFQVAPGTVTVGSPIDLSLRLDGTTEIKVVAA